MRKIQHDGGFTLMEISMALILSGIIAAVAVPKYFDMTASSQKNVCAANRSSVLRALINAEAVDHLSPTPTLSSAIIEDVMTSMGGTSEGKGLCPVASGTYTVSMQRNTNGELSVIVTCSEHGLSSSLARPAYSQSLVQQLTGQTIDDSFKTFPDIRSYFEGHAQIDSEATNTGYTGSQQQSFAGLLISQMGSNYTAGDTIWQMKTNNDGTYTMVVAFPEDKKNVSLSETYSAVSLTFKYNDATGNGITVTSAKEGTASLMLISNRYNGIKSFTENPS